MQATAAAQPYAIAKPKASKPTSPTLDNINPSAKGLSTTKKKTATSLPYKREMENHDGHGMHKYRSSSKDCRQCPLRATCIGKSDFKSITHSVDKELYDAMHHRMQTLKAKGIMRRRGSTVEPVLGSLINYTNMRRVNT